MKETCGQKQSESSEKLCQNTLFSKTSPVCYLQNRVWMKSQADLFHTSLPFSGTWLKQGIMQDGKCWELPTSALHIEGSDCGFWPTPRQTEIDRSKTAKGVHGFNIIAPDGREWGANLATAVNMWPTPNTMDTLPPKSKEALEKEATVSRKGRSQPANLRDCVSNMQNWPTPTKQDSENDGDASQYERNSVPLNAMVKKFPTPQASMMTEADMEQAKFAGNNPDRPEYCDAGKGSLNPDWVEFLMQWPIGWSSLEPIKELIWLDWSVDPADTKPPEKYPTPASVIVGKTGNSIQEWGNSRFRKEPLKKGNGDIPRVATGVKDRVNRLKAIGNGQVPLCMAVAWEILYCYRKRL